MPIRVIIFVQEAMMRAGLLALLRAQGAIDVVGDRIAGDSQLERADADVVLATVPEGGIESLNSYLRDIESGPGLLLIGEVDLPPAELTGLPVRAWGILPADASEEELFAALQALAAGLSVQTPENLQRLLEEAMLGAEPPDGNLIEALTDREREVLQLLALGLANKQIAYGLSISEHTVKFHVSSIYGKLQASNRTEAVRIGLQNGLITL